MMIVRRGVAVTVLLITIGLCAPPSSVRAQSAVGATLVPPSAATADEKEALRARAAAFWAARVDGDAKAQWEVLEPRGRGRLTPADYAPARPAVRYLAYQVEDATVNGYFATVTVRLLVQAILPSRQGSGKVIPSTAVVKDGWVRIGGIWYRSLEQSER